MADEDRYYEALGLDRSANEEDIKKAYRKLVFLYHPDRNPGDPDAIERFRVISEAYQHLSQLEKQSQSNDSKKDDSRAYEDFRYRTHQQSQGEPRCPECSITGIEHISARNGGATPTDGKRFISSPFIVVFCDNCGHVYTVAGV